MCANISADNQSHFYWNVDCVPSSFLCNVDLFAPIADLSGINIVHFQFKTISFILVFCLHFLHLFGSIGATLDVVAVTVCFDVNAFYA